MEGKATQQESKGEQFTEKNLVSCAGSTLSVHLAVKQRPGVRPGWAMWNIRKQELQGVLGLETKKQINNNNKKTQKFMWGEGTASEENRN